MKGKKRTRIIVISIIVLGLSLLLYPIISNYINELHQSYVSSEYNEKVSELRKEDYNALFEAAEEYNQKLNERTDIYSLPDSMKELYEKQLTIPGTDVMALVNIPFIGVSLPVYHGTSGAVLQRAVGHIEWSSLPIGGESTHSILSGHRGLPSSNLFTNLDKLTIGHIFTVTVLDRVITYEVDQIRVVEPNDVKDLAIVPGKDYCTLETCTPYGINTHRLLVRGHRIENEESGESITVISEGTEVSPIIVALFLIVPIIIIVIFIVRSKMKKKR